VTFGKEKANTSGVENTLQGNVRKSKNQTQAAYILHGESLFIVSSSDFKDIAFEFVTD